MDDILYEVRITALLEASVPAERIHAAFAELFCVSVVEARQRLASLPLRVRGDLSPEQAAKYQRVLARAGMACEVAPQVAPVPAVAASPVARAPAAGPAAVGEQA